MLDALIMSETFIVLKDRKNFTNELIDEIYLNINGKGLNKEEDIINKKIICLDIIESIINFLYEEKIEMSKELEEYLNKNIPFFKTYINDQEFDNELDVKFEYIKYLIEITKNNKTQEEYMTMLEILKAKSSNFHKYDRPFKVLFLNNLLSYYIQEPNKYFDKMKKVNEELKQVLAEKAEI